MSFDADVKKALPYQEIFAKDIEQYWDSTYYKFENSNFNIEIFK